MQPQQYDRHFLDFQETLMLPTESVLQRNFFRALMWGTLAGGLPFMVITVPVGIMRRMFSAWARLGLFIAILPMLVSLVGTIILMVACRVAAYRCAAMVRIGEDG